MRVLIAEGDATLREGIARALTTAGHAATSVADGLRADALLASERFDLLVLSLGLPRMDGPTVLARMRARHDEVNLGLPVLVLSTRGRAGVHVRSVDNDPRRPHGMLELEACVLALQRSRRGAPVLIGDLEWNPATRQGRIQGRTLVLSPCETVVMETLLENTGSIVPKAMLAAALGGDGISVANKVEVYIHRLRKKVTNAGLEIRNVRGLGYQIGAID